MVNQVQWGDRYLFATTAQPVTRDTGWNLERPQHGRRFTALIAGLYEMGLYEPVLFPQSALDDGYAEERGSTSSAFNGGLGCAEGEIPASALRLGMAVPRAAI